MRVAINAKKDVSFNLDVPVLDEEGQPTGQTVDEVTIGFTLVDYRMKQFITLDLPVTKNQVLTAIKQRCEELVSLITQKEQVISLLGEQITFDTDSIGA